MSLCEVVIRWGPDNTIAEQCKRPAVYRYAAMGGGWMYLCAEHGARHANYSEVLVDGEWVETEALRAFKAASAATPHPDRAFGFALAEWMERKGYTVETFAAIVGYAPSTVRQWLRGYGLSRRARATLRGNGFDPEAKP